jgi:hypothetical protein
LGDVVVIFVCKGTFSMDRKGFILTALLLVLTFGFSSHAEARGGLLEAIFGFERQDHSAPIYLAPQRDVYQYGDDHRRDARRMAHRRDGQFLELRRRAKAARPGKHESFAMGHASRPYAASRKETRRRLAMASQAVAASPQKTAPPSSERPCCANAQDAINQIVKNDPTLRPGDAYMSNEGLRVYVGERKKNSQFVPLDHARHIGASLKKRLKAVSMSPTRSVRAQDEAKARNPGHEPQQAHARASREKLVDGPEGRPIRFVGGFAK